MSEFKAPDAIPQDLLLIQEMVGAPEPPKVEPVVSMAEEVGNDSEDIRSSDGENSEDEIEANLFQGADDSDPTSPISASEPSHSSSESSDSEPEDQLKRDGAIASLDDVPDDDDEDPVPTAGAGASFTTKHEVLEADIVVPEVENVDPSEPLEKIGDIINIVNQAAIVRGVASGDMTRGSQKALDSDTLLAFDDRTVMGYVYETFGPTNQPLYQVKYNSKYPLDPERVKIGREVFMVPSKSRFVFVDQIKIYKGSDASNVYDEEPADDELEFSDDEAEATHRSRMKRKRGESRSRSVARESNLSQMRDHELVDDTILSRNAYSEHGPYDLDFATPGPSRPLPVPYDDPYSIPPEQPTKEVASSTSTSTPMPMPPRPPPRHDARPRGGSRGGNLYQNSRGRGGRGGRDFRRRGSPHSNFPRPSEPPQNLPIVYDPHTPSQVPEMSQSYQQQDFSYMGAHPAPTWGYPGMMQQQQFTGQSAGYQQGAPFVQPHINPLFAPAFGFAMNQGQNMGYGGQFAMGNPYSAGFAGAAPGGYDPQQHQQQQQWNAQLPPQSPSSQHPPGGQGQ